MLSRSSTQRRSGVEQDIPPRNERRSASNLSLGLLSPSTNPPADPRPPSTPPEATIPGAGQHVGKRGRPRKGLNLSAQRGLIRLFVDAYKTPIEQFTKALDQRDEHGRAGHGRLWIRKFFERITRAGPKSNCRLKDTRFNVADHSSQHDVEDQRKVSLERDRGTEDSTSFVADALYTQKVDDHSFQPDSSADESKPSRKIPRRQASMYAKDDDRYTAQMSSQASPNVDIEKVSNPINDMPDSYYQEGYFGITSTELVGAAMESTRPNTSANPDYRQPDQVDTSVKFSDRSFDAQSLQVTDANLGPAGDMSNYPKRKRKGKPLRRGTSLSLSRMALWLDGGIEGRHYQIAKRNTISRKMSTATSEFNMFYRAPTQTTTPALTTSTKPLLGGILPVQSRKTLSPEAVAVNLLTEAWIERINDTDAKRRTENVYDFRARRRIERNLPKSLGERQTFVNASDELKVSPIHLAVAYGFPATCQLLVESGADVNTVTYKGSRIYDFADSAARRTGEDMALYFRILHCRRFVCAGEQPPVPRKLSDTEKAIGKRKRLQTAEASPRPQETANVGDTHSGVETGGHFGRREPFDAVDIPITTQQRRPSFATELTESPTLSAIHEQRSLLSNEDVEPPVPNLMPPALPTTSYYYEPFLPILEPSGPRLSANDIATTKHAYAPVASTQLSTEPLGGYYSSYYHPSGSGRRSSGHTAPLYGRHPNYDMLQHIPQVATQRHLSGQMGLSNNNYGPARPDYGISTSPRSAPNVATLGAGLEWNQSQPNRTSLELTPQIMAQSDPNSAVDLRGSNYTSLGYGGNTWMQPIEPYVQNQATYATRGTMPPAITQHTTREASNVHVPYLGEQMLLHSQLANTESSLAAAWVCMFDDPQCQSESTCCQRCLERYCSS